MIWALVISCAVFAFLGGAVFLREHKNVLPVLGAFLGLGLAAYSLHGSPDQPSSPKSPAQISKGEEGTSIDSRRMFFGTTLLPAQFVVMSDGYVRKGDFAGAAALLDNAIADHPQDAEAWVALGNVLVAQAEGNMTPASIYAYERAAALAPRNMAPQYFMSLALLRQGNLPALRQSWAQILARAKAGDEWQTPLRQQLSKLDFLLEELNKYKANSK